MISFVMSDLSGWALAALIILIGSVIVTILFRLSEFQWYRSMCGGCWVHYESGWTKVDDDEYVWATFGHEREGENYDD